MMKRCRLLLPLLLCLPLMVSAGNQLAGHDSPYLAMHGDDPVAWQDWSAEVLARARRENKLVFVSIGYFACHWCHVMQRESYRNPRIAGLLNEHYIPVKVDRELNPALDAYLIDFVQRTRGYSGWPLNVFLTPDGHPLVGLVYLPAERFLAMLQELHDQWVQTPDYLRQTAAQAAQVMKGTPPAADAPLDAATSRRYQSIMVQQALALADELSGGFGEQTKFPMAPQLDSLLTVYQRAPEPQLKKVLLVTLDHMASQGLRDHLGGGFYRYTVDPAWHIPHFEKMLYDNALLASVYLRAARILQRPDYERVARDTLDFMLRELMAADGAMVASLSAVDAQGVEGGYYLWQEETLASILTREELALLQLLWGLQGHSELEAGHLPRLQMSLAEAARSLQLDEVVAQRRFDSARSKLHRVRASRQLPVDNKVLAAWNGLALQALVAGARLAGDESYRAAAQRLRDYLVTVLWDGQRLWRARGHAGELGQASLEDYAFAAQGLLTWARFSNNPQDLKLARRWVDAAWQRFYDDSGWRLSDQTLLPTGYGVPMLSESPLPSPSATLLRVSHQLAELQQDDALEVRVREAAQAGHGRLEQAAFDYPTQVSLLVTLFNGQ